MARTHTDLQECTGLVPAVTVFSPLPRDDQTLASVSTFMSLTRGPSLRSTGVCSPSSQRRLGLSRTPQKLTLNFNRSVFPTATMQAIC